MSTSSLLPHHKNRTVRESRQPLLAGKARTLRCPPAGRSGWKCKLHAEPTIGVYTTPGARPETSYEAGQAEKNRRRSVPTTPGWTILVDLRIGFFLRFVFIFRVIVSLGCMRYAFPWTCVRARWTLEVLYEDNQLSGSEYTESPAPHGTVG